MTSKPVKIVSHSIVSPLFAYVLSDKSFAINVHVKPNSKIDKIVVGTHALEIFTSTKPKNGEANMDVIEQMAKFLDVKKTYISLVKGHKSKDKILHLDGISQTKFQNLIEVKS